MDLRQRGVGGTPGREIGGRSSSAASVSSLVGSNHSNTESTETTPMMNEKEGFILSSGTALSIASNQSRSSSESSSSVLSMFMIKAVAIASIGGVLFGYDLGVICGALPQLTKEFSLSDKQQEMVVSFLFIGCGFGAFVGGDFCDRFGRKRTIIITDLVFCVGGLVLMLAPNIGTVLLGRIILGTAVSVSGIADVSYLTEIAPSSHRGALVSCNEACISLGFLVAYIAGYVLSLWFPTGGWRKMFGIAGTVALLQLFGILLMPESPQWLLQQGKIDEARASFAQICMTDEEAAKRFSEAQAICKGDDTSATVDESNLLELSHSLLPQNTSVSPFRSLKKYLSEIQQESAAHYKQAIAACVLAVSQQFCGQGIILNFAPEIFSQTGAFEDESALGTTLIIGLVKFLVTVIVILKVDVIGRRTLLLSGVGLIGASQFLLALAFGFTNENGDPRAYVAFVGTIGVAIGYAASFGPLTWLLVSEMFETRFRGRALGISTVVTYTCAFVVSYTFLSGQKVLGRTGPFVLYTLVTLMSLFFFVVAIPDMDGKTPHAIEEAMDNMWLWKYMRSTPSANTTTTPSLTIQNSRNNSYSSTRSNDFGVLT